ncbi:Ni/Fe hydrogenase subunit alpha [Candidatus Riflebacteria bacterium]
MSKRITIDPITRLEGHGKIEIFLNDEGEVDNCYFQVPELRGFEKFCEGRQVEEMPRITCRICGVCPEAHHMASAKAGDAVYGVDIPPAAKKLREMQYSAFYAGDHTTHFYILGGPDFVMGPDAPPAERNILGVVSKVGMELAGQVLHQRKIAHEVAAMMGGRPVHPMGSLVGGVSKGLTPEERDRVIEIGKESVEFAKVTLQVFDDIVLKNSTYVEIITGAAFNNIKTHYMGLVDSNNKVNFYDGDVRVVDVEGNEFCKYKPEDYLEHVAEHVEPWTYLKFPYLKKKGWKGMVDGMDSGVYRASPLSRLNASDGMATPLAQAEFDKMYKTLGGKPVHATLATHWARVIELMYAAERLLELAQDPEIISKDIRTVPTKVPDEGVGIVESPRGTLTHHYITDENGVLLKVNLIVGTTNNNAAICMSIKEAAKALITKGTTVTEGLLNTIEMAFRAYDPCFGCATHTLPGEMPIIVNIYDKDRNLLKHLKRD